jgi:hypothetical protein
MTIILLKTKIVSFQTADSPLEGDSITNDECHGICICIQEDISFDGSVLSPINFIPPELLRIAHRNK